MVIHIKNSKSNDFVSLLDYNPHAAAEWHPTKNVGLVDGHGNDISTPDKMSRGSSRKVWWRCSKGHEFESCVSTRAEGSQCPYCCGRRVIPGETDLATLYPQIASEWHPIKNGDVKPSDVKPGTHTKYWFLCAQGHEWLSTVANRVWGNNCPICCGQIILLGYNDLVTLNPELAAEWHPTKNIGLVDGNGKDISTPDKVGIGCKHQIWWLGKDCGHEWQSNVGNRHCNKQGCSVCAGKTIIIGKTDLATTHPHIASEWHPTRNDNLKPTHVSAGSTKRVWWICKNNHEYDSTIDHRALGNRGCPYCSNKKVLVGYNDLATTHPHIAAEWDYTKNGNLKPTDVVAGSNKKVHWKCTNNHEWFTTISSRASGCGCKVCWLLSNSSYPEQRIAYFLKQYFPDIIQSYHPHFLKGLELDIYIPSLNIAIEYDGEYFHQNKKRDVQKILMCKQNGIELIRIRESGCPDISKYCKSFTFDFNFKNTTELDNIIVEVFNYLGIKDIQLDFKEFTRIDWEKIRMKYSNLNNNK